MADTNTLRIRDIEDIAEVRAVEDLQIEAWGDDERDIVPLSQLVAAHYVGGSLIGAFDDEFLAGFVYGFYGHVRRRIVHHSHMLAVHPAYRNQDLAFRLKLAQRERVIADSLTDRITWTFDPLQSLNAYLNFAKLGVCADTYKINVYGDAGTSFLHQNGTDRFFVTWFLHSPHVLERVAVDSRVRSAKETSFWELEPLVRADDSSGPEFSSNYAQLVVKDAAVVEIPADINSIERSDLALAAEWRSETRRVFSEMLASGFIVTDFRRKDDRTGMYLLKKGRLEDSPLE